MIRYLTEYAASKFKDVLILGDANLDVNIWNEEKFLHKKVARVLKDSLSANHLQLLIVGNTYSANHAQKNGQIATSAIC